MLRMSFIMGCVSVVCMVQASAQEVAQVYPLYGVVGAETRFVAQGHDLPAHLPVQYGMKLATTPAQACTQPKRYQPVTSTGYYFSCTFESMPRQPVTMRIYTRGKKENGPVLWQGAVQILAAAPQVQQVRIRTVNQEPFTRIACIGSAPCLHVQGLASRSHPLNIEVLGSNLPHTLTLDASLCSITNGSDPWQTGRRLYTCKPSATGSSTIRVLTAQTKSGGTVLFENSFDVTE